MINEYAHKLIRRRFLSVWNDATRQGGALKDLYPAAMPKQDFDPPDAKPWIRLNILDYTNEWASMGNARAQKDINRLRGDVIVQIFTPKGTGEQLELDIAKELKKVFHRYREVAPGLKLWFRKPATLEDATDAREEKWQQLNFVAPFQYDGVD